MTAVSSSSVATVAKVVGRPATAWAKVWVPGIGDDAAGSPVMTKSSRHASTWSKPALASAPIGRSLVPSKAKSALASESSRW